MEERRLLYVGITRAMDFLYLVYSQNRSSYGYAEPADPSRFLDDIPAELLDVEQPVRSKRSDSVPLRLRTLAAKVRSRVPNFAKATESRATGEHK